jgi:hypothetical protein
MYAPLVDHILGSCSMVLPPKCPEPAAEPSFACDKCAEFAASIDIMTFVPLCMGGASAECCAAVNPFKVEPCANAMYDDMSAMYKPLIDQILDGCSIEMPARCPEAAATVLVIPDHPICVCVAGESAACTAATTAECMADFMGTAYCLPCMTNDTSAGCIDGATAYITEKCAPVAMAVPVIEEPAPEYGCDQCAVFAASLDMMTIAAPCMAGPSAECCETVQAFQIEPCVHTMMDGMPPAFKPLVDQILEGCSIVMPARCPATTDAAATDAAIAAEMAAVIAVAVAAPIEVAAPIAVTPIAVAPIAVAPIAVAVPIVELLPACKVVDWFTAGECDVKKRIGYIPFTVTAL